MGKRPPKPHGTVPNPRFKARKEKRENALDALSALSRVMPKPKHRQAFIDEINNEKNDRGAAILVVTNVENALQTCLENVLAKSDTLYDKLFGLTAPMGTFDGKIKMAYAPEIVGDEMYHNLNVARLIRNAFARSKIPITFETMEVSDAAKLSKPTLVTFNFIEDTRLEHEWEISTTTRMKFITICGIMATNLARYAHVASGLRTLTKDHETNQKLQIVVRSKPLP